MKRHAASSSTSLALVLLSLGAMACALVAAGCIDGGGGTTPTTQGAGAPAQAQLVISQETRSAAEATPGELRALVTGNTAFALDLLRTITKPDGPATNRNLVVSPYSISLALAMTYAGARGATSQEMAKVLHFTLPPERLHAAFNALDQAIASRSRDFPATTEGEQTARVELNVVNQLWTQRDFAFLPAFLDLLATDYGAGLRVLDFVQDAEAARQTINGWVADATKDRVKDLLPAGSVDAKTRLVLTNAVYLKAPWATAFEKALTADGDFRLQDGTTVTVPFMHQSETLGYAAGDGWQALELPYRGMELRMVVLVPDSPDLDSFAKDLDAAALERILSSVEQKTVNLALPKFGARSELALKDALAALGMQTAFSDEADFSGMTGRPDLAIDSVFHNGFVSVDEAGTEAAAATAVVMRETAAPIDIRTVVVDRPFLWLIRDGETGAVLFMGQVVDPRVGA